MSAPSAVEQVSRHRGEREDLVEVEEEHPEGRLVLLCFFLSDLLR